MPGHVLFEAKQSPASGFQFFFQLGQPSRVVKIARPDQGNTLYTTPVIKVFWYQLLARGHRKVGMDMEIGNKLHGKGPNSNFTIIFTRKYAARMDIPTILSRSSSRSNIDLIVSIVADNPREINCLHEHITHPDYQVAGRASWAFIACAEKKPELVAPFVDELVDLTEKIPYQNVLKNLLKILSLQLPGEEKLGKLLGLCFSYLQNAKVSIAMKSYCLDIIQKIGENEPDIRHELKETIEAITPFEKPTISRKGKKLIERWS